MKIALTGHTSSLGKTLLPLLIKQYDVVCLSRNEELQKSQYATVVGDLHNEESLKKLILECDICIHLAAQVSRAPKSLYYKTNVEGTDNLCKVIAQYRPECKLLYCSSIATFTRYKIFSFLNTHYSQSKTKALSLLTTYQDKIDYLIISPGLIYGHGYFISEVIEQLKKVIHKRLILINGGEKFCPMIHVNDLCELIKLSLQQKKFNHKNIVAIGNNSLSIHQVFEYIYQVLGAQQKAVILPKTPLLLLSHLLEILGLNTSISKRNIDILSLNFHQINSCTYWSPKRDNKEVLHQEIDAYLNK